MNQDSKGQNGPGQQGSGFSRVEADTLVRLLNLFYQRTVAYAFDHPASQELIPRAYEALRKCLGSSESLSLLFQEFGYYIGHVDLVYAPNNRKFADHLRRFGIESITITTPVSLKAFARFLDACSLTHADPMRFLAYLSNQGVTCFNVNNVVLKTVKEGDEVVAAGSSRPAGPPMEVADGVFPGDAGRTSAFDDAAMRVVLGHLTAREMNANLSLLRTLENPTAIPDAILKNATANPGQEAETLRQSLINVVGAFRTEAGQNGVPLEDLLAGMYSMRTELLKAVKAQQGLAQHLSGGLNGNPGNGSNGRATEGKASDGGKLAEAADDVFVQTAAQLVMEEYNKCKGNPKRMAQVVQRIVPDRTLLQQVLTVFRAALVRQGVPLMEFFNLLAELNTLMGTDRSYQEFLQAGESLGVSHEELLQELQENPRQAAQLILLASEARKSNREGSAEELINSLADYVEKTGEAAQERILANPREAVKLGSMLQQMEAEVNQKLKDKGIPEEMRLMGQQKLRLRMQNSLNDLKGKAAMAQLGAAGVNESEKIQFLLEMFGDEKEMEDVMGRARDGLDAEALAREAGGQVMQKVRQEMASRREKAASKDLPAGVYVKAVLDFFVKSEISRASRYNLPFSAMLISFHGLPEDKAAFETQGDALRGLQNVLIGDLRRNLRESDFVGYLSFNRILVVLPMTPLDAVSAILRKLADSMGRQVALPDGARLTIRPRVGVAGFDKETAGTYPKLYAELVRSWQAAA
ncbi:MAG: hypothetical protein JF616_12960 [Fibrobacteres bacterium]|nr:hypothetical protein [Fibrobacterota bacterium]